MGAFVFDNIIVHDVVFSRPGESHRYILANMLAFVSDKVVSLSSCVPAAKVIALVWSLASMFAFVYDKVASLSSCVLAAREIALVRSLASMRAPVHV